MKAAERRKLENLENAKLIKSKRYFEFKKKNKSFVEWVECDKFQAWYQRTMGIKWEWPHDTDVATWPLTVAVRIKGAIDLDHFNSLEYAGGERWRVYYDRRKRALKRASPIWRDEEKIKQIYIDRDAKIAIHGPGSYHVDHIIPIQGVNVSGLHCEFNLQVIPAKENLVKHNKYIP